MTPPLPTIRWEIADPSSEDALFALGEYFAELGRRFEDGFDPGDSLTADAPKYVEPDGSFLIAYDGAATVAACGALLRVDHVTAEIKRMWVSPHHRGVGLGKAMLATLEARAAALGYSAVILDTNKVLTEAITMYRRAGYTDIERYNDNPYAYHWFRKELRPSSA